MGMARQNFEEAVAEAVPEEAPAVDSNQAFIDLLVSMGLSAEQAQAVHQMALDLIEAGGAEATAPAETVEVAASKNDMNRKTKPTPEQEVKYLKRILRRQRMKMRELQSESAEAPVRLQRNASKKAVVPSGLSGHKANAFAMMNELLNNK